MITRFGKLGEQLPASALIIEIEDIMAGDIVVLVILTIRTAKEVELSPADRGCTCAARRRQARASAPSI